MRKFYATLLFISLSFASQSFAATWHVNANATGSSNGTSAANGWTSFSKIVWGRVVPGDTILVSSGTYKENVKTGVSGTSAGRITFKANGTVATSGFTVNHNYITIDGFEVKNTIAGTTTKHGIFIAGSNVEILNNIIHDTVYDGNGIVFKFRGTTANGSVKKNLIYNCYGMAVYVNGTNHLIEENEVHHMIQGSDDCDCFRAFGSGHIFRNNYIHDFTPQPTAHIDVFQTFGVNMDPCFNILFENNYIRDFAGQSFMLEANANAANIHDITFRNNVFENVLLAGNTYVNNTYIYNNTFINSGTGNNNVVCLKKASTKGDSSGSEVKNNIFYNCGTSINTGWYVILDSTITAVAQNNMVYPLKKGFNDLNGLNGLDPKFVDPANHDFHLQATSPAIGSGVIIKGLLADKDGVKRPATASIAIGTYELDSGATSAIPLAPPRNLRTQ